LAGVLLGAKTNSITGALTVAGQWRNFTAFPSILTIAIVDYAAPRWSRKWWCDECYFDGINIYKWPGARSQNASVRKALPLSARAAWNAPCG